MWPFKFVIPFAAVLLLLQGVSEFIKAWARAFGPEGDIAIDSPDAEGEVST